MPSGESGMAAPYPVHPQAIHQMRPQHPQHQYSNYMQPHNQGAYSYPQGVPQQVMGNTSQTSRDHYRANSAYQNPSGGIYGQSTQDMGYLQHDFHTGFSQGHPQNQPSQGPNRRLFTSPAGPTGQGQFLPRGPQPTSSSTPISGSHDEIFQPIGGVTDVNRDTASGGQSDSIFSKPLYEVLGGGQEQQPQTSSPTQPSHLSQSMTTLDRYDSRGMAQTQYQNFPDNSHNQILSAQDQQKIMSDTGFNPSGSQTQRVGKFRSGPRQKTNEVMIINIDKATIQHISKDINEQDVIDISYSLINKNILIVRFSSQLGAQWAVSHFDGKTINNRRLQVTIAVDPTHQNIRRKWEPPNLAKINESNDIDEEVEPDYPDVCQQQNANQGENNRSKSQKPNSQSITPGAPGQIQNYGANSTQQNLSNTFAGAGSLNINQSMMNPQSYGGSHSITPPPGFQRAQTVMNQGYQHGLHQARPNVPNHPQTSMRNLQSPFDVQQQNMFGNSNQQYHTQNPIPGQPVFAPPQYHPGFNPLIGGYDTARGKSPQQPYYFQGGPQQQAPPQFSISQYPHHHYGGAGGGTVDFSRNLAQQPGLQQYGQYPPQTPSAQYQMNPPQFSNFVPGELEVKNSTPNPNSQIFEMPQHHHHNNPIISESDSVFQQPNMLSELDRGHYVSQGENQRKSDADSQLKEGQAVQEGNPNSDRGSFLQQQQPNTLATRNNLPMTGSTRNSDSDNSGNFPKFIFPTQYQSPVSGRKLPLNHENSFEYNRNPPSNSGHDTPPPSYMTPGSNNNKQMNNSFNQINPAGTSSQQSLTQLQTDIQLSHQLGIHHNRNFSHNQQLQQHLARQDSVNSQMMIGVPAPPHLQTQQFIFNHQSIMQRSVSYVNVPTTNQIMMPSNSSDFNDMSQYHMHPFNMTQQHPLPYHDHLSSSNSSFDISNQSHSKAKKGKGGSSFNKSYQSHMSLKNVAYSESSITSLDQQMYELDIEKIKRGEDLRTTVMVRHIPNKYNQKMLLQEINKRHQGKYDFFYLPIDYQNSANVGYAFINFVHHLFILDFYHEFHNRRWQNFNSKKRCDIKYGRIQGLEDLKRHFQQSSVMNQNDENFRPRIFEQHNKMDWTVELKKITEKYKMQGSAGEKPKSHTTTLSQGSQPQSYHQRQQSIGSSNNMTATQQSLSTQRLVEESVAEEEEDRE